MVCPACIPTYLVIFYIISEALVKLRKFITMSKEELPDRIHKEPLGNDRITNKVNNYTI